MKMLIACEMSGRVRDAFLRRGHDAWSCDLLPSLSPGPHITGDVRDVLLDGWDMVIAFPPCTHLAVSGARWFAEKRADGRQSEGIEFFRLFIDCAPRVCIENPKGIMSRLYRKPDQIIQPWQFGHGETKETHLWLRGLPVLRPTAIVPGREPRIHRMPPGPDRAMLRNLTYQGVADAMAAQWGGDE